MRFFSLEPALPARPAHYTHVVGRLHVRHGPTRLAHVDRADKLNEAASRCSRGSMDIYACSEQQALRLPDMYMYHRCFSRMLVHVFARSVRLARGSKAHHVHRASSHVY